MHRAVLASIALLMAAPAAFAEEVRLGGHFESEYNSLVTSLGGDTGDFTFEFGPSLEVTGERKRIDYQIEHRSYYRKYAEVEQLDDWRHETSVRASFAATPRLRFTFQDRFSVRPQRSTRPEEDGEDEILDRLGNNQLLTNSFSATARLTPIPRLTNTFQVSHLFRSFDNPTLNAQDTSTLTTRTTTTYQLTEDHTIGGGFRFRRRLFSTSSISNSSSNSYEAFGTWTWRVDARTTFNAQVGPSWADDKLGEVSVSVPRYATVPGTNFLADASTCQFQNPVEITDPILGPPNTIPIGFNAILDASCMAVLDDNGTPGDPNDDFTQVALDTQQAMDNLTLGPVFDPFLSAGLDQFAEGAKPKDDVNLFFTLGISRLLDRGRIYASWSRSDSQTQGLGSATIVDSVITGLVLDLTSRTSATTTFRYTHRVTDAKTTAEFPVFFGPSIVFLGPDESTVIDTGLVGGAIVGAIGQEQTFKQTDDIFSFDLFLSREMGRDWTLFSGLTVRRQDSDSKTDLDERTSSNSQWEVRIGFNYRFRPFQL